MPGKSYAAATSAHAPDPAAAPHPSLALLDGAQPANRDALLQRHPHALDQLEEASDHIDLLPHRSQGSGAERGHGQNESKASRSDGNERVHSNREPKGRQSGKHFASTIPGHPAMEGKQSPADIGGDLVEPCEPMPLCAASRTPSVFQLTPKRVQGYRAPISLLRPTSRTGRKKAGGPRVTTARASFSSIARGGTR